MCKEEFILTNNILTDKTIIFTPDANTELRKQFSRSRGVTLVNGNLTSNARTDVSGVSARVYKNGTYGFSSMAEVSDDAVRAVLNAATENAEFMSNLLQREPIKLVSISTEPISSSNDFTAFM